MEILEGAIAGWLGLIGLIGLAGLAGLKYPVDREREGAGIRLLGLLGLLGIAGFGFRALGPPALWVRSDFGITRKSRCAGGRISAGRGWSVFRSLSGHCCRGFACQAIASIIWRNVVELRRVARLVRGRVARS